MISFSFIVICGKWFLWMLCCLSFPNSTSLCSSFSCSQWKRVDTSTLIYSTKSNGKPITFSRILWIFAFRMFWCYVFFWKSIWMFLRFIHNYPLFVGITSSNTLLSLLLKVSLFSEFSSGKFHIRLWCLRTRNLIIQQIIQKQRISSARIFSSLCILHELSFFVFQNYTKTICLFFW